jgi:hypothetical protein
MLEESRCGKIPTSAAADPESERRRNPAAYQDDGIRRDIY